MENSMDQLRRDKEFFDREVAKIGDENPSGRRRSFLMAGQSGPRMISLGRFKAAQANFNKIGDELEAALGTRASTISSSFENHTNSMSDMASSSLSHSLGSEAAEDPLQQCTMTVLSILRCYLYNLQEGTLVTEEKVDGRIADFLREMVGSTNKSGNMQELVLRDQNSGESGDEGSDEDGVLNALGRYQKLLLGHGEEIDKEIKSAADKILAWAETNGVLTMDLEDSWEIFELEI